MTDLTKEDIRLSRHALFKWLRELGDRVEGAWRARDIVVAINAAETFNEARDAFMRLDAIRKERGL